MATYEQRKELFESYAFQIGHKTGSREMLLKEQISPKILKVVEKRIMPGYNGDEILGFMDTTVAGSGKNGFLFMEKHLYYLELLGKPVHIRYKDIDKLDLDNCEDEDNKNILYIETKSDKEYRITSPFLNMTPLYEYLQKAIALENGERDSSKKNGAMDVSVGRKEIKKDMGAEAAGIAFSSVSISQANYNADKFLTPRGHGFAAENANHLVDKIENADFFGQEKVMLVGDDIDDVTGHIIKNGADRIVNGVNIQTKYCQSGSKCIGECFENGKMRYINADGTPMQIEVPSDMYEDAVKAMQNRISRGEVPSVTDPSEAENIVRKGHFTYEQAKNIAKAGTVESLAYDALNGMIIATSVLGITALISFATSVWNGEDADIALKNATYSGLKASGVIFITSVISGQIAKTSANQMLMSSSQKIVEMIGPKASSVLVKALGTGNNIYGAAAMKSAAKLLRGNIIANAVSFTVMSTGDIISIFRGRISPQQLMKNMGVLAASTGGGMVGWIAGAAAGAAIGSTVPVIGTAIGGMAGFAGAALGGSVAGKAADKLLENFVEEDADKMTEILEKKFQEMAINYLLNQKETMRVADGLSDVLDEKKLKDMYASQDWEEFAEDVLLPIVEDVIEDREKICIPSDSQICDSMRIVLEEIAEEGGDISF